MTAKAETKVPGTSNSTTPAAAPPTAVAMSTALWRWGNPATADKAVTVPPLSEALQPEARNMVGAAHEKGRERLISCVQIVGVVQDDTLSLMA